MPLTVLLASAIAARGKDPDEAALLAALADRGLDARPAAWDDPDVDWAAADLVVLRSTWDYAERLEEFLGWLDRVAAVTRLRNPADVVRWNVDKRYLDELAAAGVAVVPTRFAAPGEPLELPTDRPAVVKPAVAAGSRDAILASPDHPGDTARARAHAARLHAEGRTVMLQPHVASVDARGETAVIHLAGAYSHAVAKGAMLSPGARPIDGLFAPERLARREPTPAELDAAERTLAAAGRRLGRDPGELLYARVDVVEADDGSPQVLELEVTEPSLFLRYATGSVDRLADAIAAAARGAVTR